MRPVFCWRGYLNFDVFIFFIRITQIFRLVLQIVNVIFQRNLSRDQHACYFNSRSFYPGALAILYIRNINDIVEFRGTTRRQLVEADRPIVKQADEYLTGSGETNCENFRSARRGENSGGYFLYRLLRWY